MSLQKFSFVKMHGAGNDFIILNGLSRLPFDLHQFVVKACDRHFGIGADGVLVLTASKRAEFGIQHFNADGSPGSCANGIRCLARYVYSQGLLPAEQRQFEIETAARVVRVEVIGKGDRIRVDMGQATFDGAQIPTSESGEWVAREVEVSGHKFSLSAVGMGDPHGVVFVDDLAALDVEHFGRLLREHPLFPERANIEFVQVIDPIEIRVEVLEQGVGRTLASGTGICAAVAAGWKEGLLDQSAITVRAAGGDFLVTLTAGDRIFLTGPAQEVYRGELDLEQGIGVKLSALGSGVYPAQN